MKNATVQAAFLFVLSCMLLHDVNPDVKGNVRGGGKPTSFCKEKMIRYNAHPPDFASHDKLALSIFVPAASSDN